jgi:hypothetical protein
MSALSGSRRPARSNDCSEISFLGPGRTSPGRRRCQLRAPFANIPRIGHHSPIGRYLENEDLVFILDVNSDYKPWLVERIRLFAAVNTFDGEKKRELLLIE